MVSNGNFWANSQDVNIVDNSRCCQKLVQGQLSVRQMMDSLGTHISDSVLCWTGVQNVIYALVETVN